MKRIKEKLKNHINQKYENNEEIIFSFDFDDTLVNSIKKVIDYINNKKEYVKILKEKNLYPFKEIMIEDYYTLKNIFGEELTQKIFTNDFLYKDDLLLKKNTIKILKYIKTKIKNSKIQIVTAYIGEEAKNNKNIYIQKHLEKYIDETIHDSDKEKHVRGTIFIDDGFHNIKNLKENTICFCKTAPWNQKYKNFTEKKDNMVHIDELDELYKVLKIVVSSMTKKRSKISKI